jgi:hypothetical protein
MAEESESEKRRRRWRDKFTSRKGDLKLTDRDRMTGEELRADALKNDFVMDDEPADFPILQS